MNHTICNYLGLTSFSLSIMPLKSMGVLHVSVIHSFLLLSNVPLFGCFRVYSTIHPLNDIWVLSNIFFLLWIEFLRILVHGFLCEMSFYFSGINAQEWLLNHMVNTVKLIFQSGYTIYIHTSDIWPYFSPSSSAFGIITVFYFSFSNRYIVIAHCDFS